MPQEVFPFELVHPCTESLYTNIGAKSHALYWVLAGSILIALALLPVVRVDVSVQARGQIANLENNVPLTANIQGQVVWEALREDRTVRAGERLVLLNTQVVREQENKMVSQIKEREILQRDLQKLTSGLLEKNALESKIYQKEYNQFLHEFKTLETKWKYAGQALERSEKLFSQAVIAKTEYENAFFEETMAASEVAVLKERQLKNWEIELREIEKELAELRSERKLLQHQEKSHEIQAPSDGTIVEPASLKPGSYVFPGQELAKISSHEALIAEVYIPSAKVGYIYPGSKALVQLDAYNFHEWGALEGKVENISREARIVNQIPVFVARIALNDKELKLRNGFRGQIKKGMTLSCRFLLTERSLLSLVRENVEDWLDPRSFQTEKDIH